MVKYLLYIHTLCSYCTQIYAFLTLLTKNPINIFFNPMLKKYKL